MNLIIKVLLLVGLISAPRQSRVDNNKPCNARNTVFEDGERMVYKIYYNVGFIWISAGEVVFKVKDRDDKYHISAAGRTYKSYDWVFKVRDYYDSFITKETMMPQRTVRSVLEGNYRLYDDVTYKHKESIAVSKKGKTKEDLNTEEVSLEGCTHDILSSIYTLRNMDFSESNAGTKVPLSVYLDRKIYNLDVVFRGVEKRKRIKGLGLCNALQFQPQLVVGTVFKDNDGMNVWVSNDQNKIPLMIESPISVGSVKAVLTKYEGLKYPTSFK